MARGNRSPRTEKQLAAARLSIRKAASVAWSLPRSAAQLAVTRAPRTEKQVATLKHLRSYPRTEKQLRVLAEGRAIPKTRVNAGTIDCHHNDLHHGKERPNDVIFMSHAEHAKTHSSFRKRDKSGRWI